MACGGECGCAAILECLGYNEYNPGATYGLDAIAINFGVLWQSLIADNTSIPGGSDDWVQTTVAALMATASGQTFTYPTWRSGGGAGIGGNYLMNQAVHFNGGNYISLIDANADNPEGSSNWQYFSMGSQ